MPARATSSFDPNAASPASKREDAPLRPGYSLRTKARGATWSSNTITLAKNANLLTDLEVAKLGDPMTREDAAQMIFNALQADTVFYKSNTSKIVVGDTTIVTGGTAPEKVANNNTDYNASGDTVMQWCEEHFASLAVADGVETTGAPAHVWSFDKGDGEGDVEIARFAPKSTKAFSGTAVTIQNLYDFIGTAKFCQEPQRYSTLYRWRDLLEMNDVDSSGWHQVLKKGSVAPS